MTRRDLPCVQSQLAQGQMDLPEGDPHLLRQWGFLLAGDIRHAVFAGVLSTLLRTRWLCSTSKKGVRTQV